MFPQEALRECTSGCRVPHYENCPDCWGFGVHGPSDTPVNATQAINGPVPAECKPCATCGSTVAGIPGRYMAELSTPSEPAVPPLGWTPLVLLLLALLAPVASAQRIQPNPWGAGRAQSQSTATIALGEAGAASGPSAVSPSQETKSSGIPARRWTTWDKVAVATGGLLILADWSTTLHGLREGGVRELNPLLGEQPSEGRVNFLVGAGLAAYSVGAAVLPKQFRRPMVWAVVVLEVYAVAWNLDRGHGFAFP